MERIYYLLIMILAVSITACQEDDDLPKPTQTGAMMMAAKINGKSWQHNGAGGTLTSGDISVSYVPGGTLQIIGRRVDNDFNNVVTLQLSEVVGVGTYELNEKADGRFALVTDGKDRNNEKVFYTNSSSTGTVTFTKIDNQNKIISGTFAFRAQNRYNLSEFVEVTEGRFDVKYK